MHDSLMLPVLVGVDAGSLFIVILYIVIAQPFAAPPFDESTRAVITEENRAMVARLIETSRNLEEVELFLKQYPFARMDPLYLNQVELYGGARKFPLGPAYLLSDYPNFG